MFPELLPGAPTAAMERLAKAAPGDIAWQYAGEGLLGSVSIDDGLAYVCMRGNLSYTGRKGFSHIVRGHAEAKRFLLDQAAELGLPNEGEIEGRCWEIAYHYGEPDLAAYNEERPFGKAEFHGAQLITDGDRVLGLTVAGTHTRYRWSEMVEDWETLAARTVEHAQVVEAVEGSYSVVMPADGPKLYVAASSYIDGPDGHRYPVATDEIGGGTKIHLSADQVRALIGESCFETLEFPGADGKPRYVCRWLWDDGATRFLIVGEDGRAPKRLDTPREYVTREEIEAALAGETVPAEPAPIVEAEGNEPTAETKRGAVSPGPMWKGEPWADVLRECARNSITAFECVDGVVSMVANERDSNYRTRIPKRWQAIARALFEAQAREYARAGCSDRWAPLPYYGPPAPEPVQREAERVAAVTPPAEPATVPSEPENGSTEQSEAPADPIPAILARLEALEAAIAEREALPVESAATPIPVKPKRSPAHERAIRRAWRERCERIARADLDRRAMLKVNGDNRLLLEQLHQAEAERSALQADLQRASATIAAAERSAQQHWREAEAVMGKRLAATGRARRMVAAERARRRSAIQFTEQAAQAMVDRARTEAAEWKTAEAIARKDEADARERTRVVEAELARLRADLADPSQPERESDLVKLRRERDEARNATAALVDRCKRAETARDELADVVEGMASRVAVAEAAVRRLAAAA